MSFTTSAPQQVNARLAKDEAAGRSHADPAFPKAQWPSMLQCPKCLKEGTLEVVGEQSWNLEAVAKYLDEYYKTYKVWPTNKKTAAPVRYGRLCGESIVLPSSMQRNP